MAMITKSQISTLLGISDSSWDNNLYLWSKAQFFLLTGFKEAITTKNYRRIFPLGTYTIQLPDSNIKEIVSIKQDNVILDYTINSSYYLNPDTGTIKFVSGVSNFVEIQYKVNAYTFADIHSYLVVLLVCKALSTFNPQLLNNVQSVNIGRYSKTISRDNVVEDLDAEITRVKDIILEQGDGEGLAFGGIA